MLYGNPSSIVKKTVADEDVYYKMTMSNGFMESGLIEWADEFEIRKQQSKSLLGPLISLWCQPNAAGKDSVWFGHTPSQYMMC